MRLVFFNTTQYVQQQWVVLRLYWGAMRRNSPLLPNTTNTTNTTQYIHLLVPGSKTGSSRARPVARLVRKTFLSSLALSSSSHVVPLFLTCPRWWLRERREVHIFRHPAHLYPPCSVRSSSSGSARGIFSDMVQARDSYLSRLKLLAEIVGVAEAAVISIHEREAVL